MDDASAAAGVSRESVVWAYRLLLGREPESDEAIATHLGAADRQALVRAFVASDEFRRAYPSTVVGPLGSRLAGPMSIELASTREELIELTNRVAGNWRELGRTMPHWSVLASDQFLPENIQTNQEQFFGSGAHDLAQLLGILDYLGREPAEFTQVTDFGCGVGRVTNHLARTFKSVVACDISTSHLELARDHAAKAGLDNIEFRDVTVAKFGMSERIDLWFSHLVLQHNPPPVMAAIVRRMLFRLRVGGVAIFQVPTFLPHYSFRVGDYLATPRNEQIEMHVLPVAAVIRLANEADCVVLEILDDTSTESDLTSSVFVIGR
jgi:SAM-dependent methyltransferase